MEPISNYRLKKKQLRQQKEFFKIAKEQRTIFVWLSEETDLKCFFP